MPDQLLVYSIENPLVTISKNFWSWGVMIIRLDIDLGELVKVVQKTCRAGKGVGGWVKRYGSCCVLWPLCVFGCSSAAVMEGVCVSGFRGLGLCIFGTVV
jgi:hypothetical protein